MLVNRRSFGIHSLTEEQIKTAVKNGLNEQALTIRLCIPPYWTIEKAINTPVRKIRRLEITWTIEDLQDAKENGIEKELFVRRIRTGFTIEDAKTTPRGIKRKDREKSG